MPIFDSQVHAYERNHPGRPWVGTLHGPAEVTGDQMVAAMDAVGVDGAVLVSPFSMYRYDPSYVLEVEAKHADRFCLVKPVDPNDPDVADNRRREAAYPLRSLRQAQGQAEITEMAAAMMLHQWLSLFHDRPSHRETRRMGRATARGRNDPARWRFQAE